MTEAQLRAFVAVAETGSFAGAARTLLMTQPGVSRAVAALEKELGGPLVAREPGASHLTALGERVLLRARRMLAEAEAVRQDASATHGELRGRVRLGSMPSVSGTVLPPLLARVRRRHPLLTVVAVDGHDDELVRWVRDGTVDVAVVAGRHDGLDGPVLATDDLLAVLPPGHPLARDGGPVARAALGDDPFVLTQAGCETIILAALREAGVEPTVGYEVLEASAILSLVGEGLGVSVIPALSAQAATPGHPDVALRPLDPPAQRELRLVTPAGRDPSQAVAAVLAEVS